VDVRAASCLFQRGSISSIPYCSVLNTVMAFEERDLPLGLFAFLVDLGAGDTSA
jgi:hypothetical protein